MKAVRIVTLIVLYSALIQPATAAAEDRWNIRLYGAILFFDAGRSDVTEFFAADITSGSELGVGVGAEYLLTKRWGVEVNFLFSAVTLDYKIESFLPPEILPSYETEFDIDYRPITLGLNYHLTPSSRVDFYLGLMYAYVDYGSEFIPNPIGPPTPVILKDDDSGWGAQLGIDVPLGEQGRGPWILAATVKFHSSTVHELTEPDIRSNDLELVTVGIGRRF